MDDVDIAKKIISESGNNFHSKVVECFRERGWSVSISPYYLDGSTNKPREIDLVTEIAKPYNDVFKPNVRGNVTVKLFVECKYIPKVNVFWIDQVNEGSALSWLKKHLPGDEHKVWLEKHHYVTSGKEVAKLFGSENGKQTENEPFYKAINQSLNSVVNLRSGPPVIPNRTNGYPNPPVYCLAMPVIICNSFEKLYSTSMVNGADPVNMTDHFKIEIDYAYLDSKKRNVSEYFLIDVVDFNNIETYFKALEEDIDLVMKML